MALEIMYWTSFFRANLIFSSYIYTNSTANISEWTFTLVYTILFQFDCEITITLI